MPMFCILVVLCILPFFAFLLCMSFLHKMFMLMLPCSRVWLWVATGTWVSQTPSASEVFVNYSRDLLSTNPDKVHLSLASADVCRQRGKITRIPVIIDLFRCSPTSYYRGNKLLQPVAPRAHQWTDRERGEAVDSSADIICHGSTTHHNLIASSWCRSVPFVWTH